MDWGKEWIDFGFATLATALGVLGAFELDRWRERIRDGDKKRKLIQSLLDEFETLLDYMRKNPNVQKFQDYHLQTDVIEETIKEQLEYFDQKTNKLLKQTRMDLIIMNDRLAEWTELNKAATGIGNYPTREAAHNATNIQGGWNTFIISVSNEVELLKKELEREKVKS